MSEATELKTVLSPSQAMTALDHTVMSKQRPVFLWGPPGIGKSDIVHQLGRKHDAHVIDVRLSLWEPTDIKGIPFFDSNQGKMAWAPPIELPDDEFAAQHEKIILFLDEMNSAAPSVQAAAYQLILNRRVGTYKLPDNVFIIAAGNRDGDKGVTFRMPAPLANRFIHLEMAVNFEDWSTWAVENRIHKDVIGYVTFAKNDLYDFDPRSSSRSFATPRSWSFVSEVLDDDLDEATTSNIVAGAIGDGLAVKFMKHREIAGTLPNPTDVLSGKVKEMKAAEVSAMYSLTISMCYELQDFYKENGASDEFFGQVNNFLQFMMDNFDKEMTIMGVKLALSKYALPVDPEKVACFGDFHKNYGKLIKLANGINV